MANTQEAQERSVTAALLPWVERLTGLDVRRCEIAIASLRDRNAGPVSTHLLQDQDLDTCVAAVLLEESVVRLVQQGAPENKIQKKLRTASDASNFWATWAELRAAALLVSHPEREWRIELEPDRGPKQSADYRLHYEDGGSHDIEFKAVGLSDREAKWHHHAAGHFDRLLPPIGLATAHARLGQADLRVPRAKLRRVFSDAANRDASLRQEAPEWAGLRGICLVGHQAEAGYMKRVRSAVETALAQVDSDRECLVAFWWGNGAPILDFRQVLRDVEAPPNVVGLLFIGQALAVPWSNINVFIAGVDRYAEDRSERIVESAVDDHLAQLVLDRFDSSAGMRPTALHEPGKGGAALLRRDGRRRILPYNLLFDADPKALASPQRKPSSVQDVQILR